MPSNRRGPVTVVLAVVLSVVALIGLLQGWGRSQPGGYLSAGDLPKILLIIAIGFAVNVLYRTVTGRGREVPRPATAPADAAEGDAPFDAPHD